MNGSEGHKEIIVRSHGGGGSRTAQLIDELIIQYLDNPILKRLDDAACLTLPDTDVAFSTDSFVIQPLFFPGGDIGKMAACGTLNDLAMQGARPRFLSLALILEEGLPISDLQKVLRSIAGTCKAADVLVVTGDTKVIERGANSGILINTSGIGIRYPGTNVHVSNACDGDVVIVTGTLGDHGIAVMGCREGLEFESEIVSDCADLSRMAGALLESIPTVHCLRDPTRGGLAAALCDIARASGVGIRIRERDLPVRKAVAGACRLLGFDVLNVANEGKAIVICPESDAAPTLEILHAHPEGKEARVIGSICREPRGMVVLETAVGGERVVEPPSGEDLPRIC